MNTRLSHLCEAIIEAGWLAALIITPLFFNVHSSRVFEPDKLSLLRSIALVMAVAWLVKIINNGFGAGEGNGDAEAGTAGRESLWRRLRGTPLALPALVLVLVYLVSTLLSLSPRISWWGSYQRLQGTYTTYSYIVIFFLALSHLRRPEQWRRITYAIILTSLPISIYGVLQRTGLDPLPWGGNVQNRVASNMGNAIFVAAYLLMAFYLTLQRLLVHFGRLLNDQGTKAGLADAILAGSYLFIIIVQMLTVIYTKSRGPFLGLAAGLYIFALVGLLGLRTTVDSNARIRGPARFLLRWGWVDTVGIAVAGVAFLVIFNLPSSPLASLRDHPYIGRLGTALDLESNTAQVRMLIWEGVVELMPPHEPLEYPTTGGEGDVTVMTPDGANALRPLVGYGPEAMWVAFNRFYPPDLAHHESRNASPDRSHNETFDSLVITGVFGFIAYIALFMSVFYYCLKWLGLMRSQGQRLLFIILALAGSVLGAILPYVIQGSWVLLGAGLPAGLIIGIILYITFAAIWNERQGVPVHLGRRELVIMTILATVVAHFIEIHFGIAIAATRTYFWLLSAVLVTVGMGWLKLEEPAAALPTAAETPAAPVEHSRSRNRSRHRRHSQRRRPVELPPPRESLLQRVLGSLWQEVMVYAVLLGIVLFTLAYNFIVNPNVLELRDTSAIPLFWHSLTSRVENGVRITSLGVFWMVAFTWLVSLGLTLFSIARQDENKLTARWLAGSAALYSAISGAIFLFLGLIHAANIARDARVQQPGGGVTLDGISDMAAGHIATYYLLAFLLIALLGVTLWRTRPAGTRWLGPGAWIGPLAGAVLIVAVAFFISAVNVNLVQADIIYKQGQAYDSAGEYAGSIFLYDKAIQEQPTEDYYYLFLGRAQLERARDLTGEERQNLLREAEQSLLRAQELNPLNTDHTANLGRLYLTWAQMSGAEERQALIQRSLDYYAVAASLSPNAAHLHNEYGTAYQVAGDLDKAQEQFEISLGLDQEYDDTYRRLGDLYREMGEVDKSIESYENALKIRSTPSVHSTLGYLYAQQDNLPKAIEHNLAVVERRPRDLASHRNLAILYQRAGDLESALSYAQRALELTQDEEERPALEALIRQIQVQLGG